MERAKHVGGYDLSGQSTPSMLKHIPQYKVALPFLGREQTEQLVSAARAVRKGWTKQVRYAPLSRRRLCAQCLAVGQVDFW